MDNPPRTSLTPAECAISVWIAFSTRIIRLIPATWTRVLWLTIDLLCAVKVSRAAQQIKTFANKLHCVDMTAWKIEPCWFKLCSCLLFTSKVPIKLQFYINFVCCETINYGTAFGQNKFNRKAENTGLLSINRESWCVLGKRNEWFITKKKGFWEQIFMGVKGELERQHNMNALWAFSIVLWIAEHACVEYLMVQSRSRKVPDTCWW